MNRRMVSSREIAGKRIVRIEARPRVVGNATIHEPSIYLDDGSVLVFVAEESPDGGDYGVWIGRVITGKGPA